MELVGIPDSVQDTQVMDKTLIIFQKICDEVSSCDIEVYKRLK